MQRKLPYYMVYPMPFVYDDGRVEEKDIEYMKSLYPDVAKRILPYVEEECDRMEYHNSMIYDEYPDRLQLRMMCSRVYDNVRKNEKIFFGTGYENMLTGKMMAEEMETEPETEAENRETEGAAAVNSQQMRRTVHPSRPSRPQRPPRQGQPDWLRDMIEIMLYQELVRRRRENRSSREWDRNWDFRSNP